MPTAPAPLTRHSLDDLATLAGLTPRTVRYYIQLGLVDRPEGEKRGSHYLPRHLDQLLQVRRWTEAGLSLERIAELRQGAPAEPPPRPVRPGMVEVWSRVTLADGLELHIEPGRAGLAPEQVRALVRALTQAYRAQLAEARAGAPGVATQPDPGQAYHAPADPNPAATPQTDQEDPPQP